MWKKILIGVALMEAIIIIFLMIVLKNHEQNTNNAITRVSPFAAAAARSKALSESGTFEDMLTVSRELTHADNTTIAAKLDVVCAKIYRQYVGMKDGGSCDIINKLTLYGPFHQKMSDEQMDDHHRVPLLNIDPLHGKISYELTEAGELYIQIAPNDNSTEVIQMKLNLRKKDKNGQEWELVWRPFMGDEAQSSHDTFHSNEWGGVIMNNNK